LPNLLPGRIRWTRRIPLRLRRRTGVAAAVAVGFYILDASGFVQPAAAENSPAEAERRTVEEIQRRSLPVPPPEERRRLIEGFFPSLGRAAFDTTPVAFEIAGMRLVVPANYISSAERDPQGRTTTLVLHVLLPDMEGVTRANLPCIRQAPNCGDYVRVIVKLPQRLVARDILANVLRLTPQDVRQPWPVDRENIWQGQASDGSGRLYFQAERPADDQTILARCLVHAGGVPGGCIAADNRLAGLAFSYVFPGQQIEQLVRLDGQVRALIRRFLQ